MDPRQRNSRNYPSRNIANTPEPLYRPLGHIHGPSPPPPDCIQTHSAAPTPAWSSSHEAPVFNNCQVFWELPLSAHRIASSQLPSRPQWVAPPLVARSVPLASSCLVSHPEGFARPGLDISWPTGQPLELSPEPNGNQAGSGTRH